MPGRHHSATELAFLKESYAKHEKRAYGGHTLDLINDQLVREFQHLDLKQVGKNFRDDLKEVENKLKQQKQVLTKAFVDGENGLLAGRRGASYSPSSKHLCRRKKLFLNIKNSPVC